MTEQRIIDRIRKMLALANDLAASENEREVALRMAYNLLAKYNLELEDVQHKAKEEPRINNSNVCFGMPWVRLVSRSIAELFFCHHYVGEKINSTQITHHFIGKESNAITAAVMADWITKSILKECRARYKYNLSADSRSFASGAAERLYERIQEMRKEAEQANSGGDGKSLVLASVYRTEADANTRFLAEQGIKLRTLKGRSTSYGANAYGAGREFGNTINLNRQVGQAPVARLK
jgi:hypothetical protein